MESQDIARIKNQWFVPIKTTRICSARGWKPISCQDTIGLLRAEEDLENLLYSQKKNTEEERRRRRAKSVSDEDMHKSDNVKNKTQEKK